MLIPGRFTPCSGPGLWQKFVQTGPYALVSPGKQKNPTPVEEDQIIQGERDNFGGFGTLWQLTYPVLVKSNAFLLPKTGITGRFLGCAHRRSQIHQGLVVIAGPRRIQKLLSGLVYPSQTFGGVVRRFGPKSP
jgi:hypothetical protein